MSAPNDYNFKSIEPKWQKYWDENSCFAAASPSDKPKFYLLDMFPYPSGSGLHAGHAENYTASDILGRYKRAKGFNVLHPMGWDAFGLPAEQYAIKTGTHPAETTQKNVDNFREQIKRLGIAVDWSKEVNTTDPAYFKWTQWIFLQLFKKGLAYVDERPVNWCPELGTVLANEEVIDGRSEVGGFPVERRALRQWVLKITAYADSLLEGLNQVDWPESTKTQQANWIGKSTGAEIDFEVDRNDERIKVYTTRPDTLFGATYMVLAPEHPLVAKITTSENKVEVEAYIRQSASKSDLDRTDLAKDKTGVFSGAYAINPVNGTKIPIWVADYVLMGYGTGGIMAVPAHDERDFEFATAFDIPVIQVISARGESSEELPYSGDGKLVNSGEFNGLNVDEAKKAIVAKLAEQGVGEATTNYRLRDWLFSRQRYWGEPFPIIWVGSEDYQKIIDAKGRLSKNLPPEPISYSEDGTTFCAVPVLDEFLPLILPETDDYKPSGDARGPLANQIDWVNLLLNVDTGEQKSLDSDSGSEGQWIAGHRETNTMPQWAGSCWYYLRYCDPNNAEELISKDAEAYWQVPDMYIGGAEHAVLHLLYARFWHQFLYDLGVVTTKEPFGKLFHQGIILGEMEFTSFKDEDGNHVSYSEVDPEGDWCGTTEKVDPTQVDKIKVNKDDIYVLKSNHEIQVDGRSFKMSKSRGNVVNPDDYIDQYGADSLRLYEMFMGPLAEMKPWNTQGIEGPHRFLKKLWRLLVDREGKIGPNITEGDETTENLRALNTAIEKVTSDIESFGYNTAISQLMILVNHLQKVDGFTRDTASVLIQLVSPFAPHIGEELWERLGNKSPVSRSSWPHPIELKEEDERVKVIFQVNGKLRGEGLFSKSATEEEVKTAALSEERVSSQVEGKTIRKVIYVPGRILNLVAN